MCGDDGDVGRGRVARARHTCGRVFVDDAQIARVYGVNQSAATSVVKGGPSRVVSVEVAEEESVAVGVVEERREIGFVERWAGDGWNVDAVDVKSDVVKEHFGANDLDGGVVVDERRDVNGNEREVMMNEEGDAATAAGGSVAPKEHKAPEETAGEMPSFVSCRQTTRAFCLAI